MRRRGIGNVIATMIFVLILFSTITSVYLYYVKKQGDFQQAYFNALERKVQAQKEKISASFTFGNSTDYRPSSYTLLKGSSTDPVDRLYERDSSYLNISSTTDVDYGCPVENMNFTDGIDGWRETYQLFSPPPTELYVDYSPNMGYFGSGSLWVGFRQNNPNGSARLMISTFFTLSSPPSSALDSYLSWASYVKQISGYEIEIRIILKNPNGVSYNIDRRITSSPDESWVFDHVTLDPPSGFWVRGTYTFSILFESRSYVAGTNTIQAYIDDIGLKLATRTIRVTDYYATFPVDMGNVDSLLIHHTGHCTSVPFTSMTEELSPSSGGVIGNTRTVSGDYSSLNSTDHVYWHTSSTVPYNPATSNVMVGSVNSGSIDDLNSNDGSYYVINSAQNDADEDHHPDSYSTIGGTTHESGSLSDLQSSDDNYMAFRGYIDGKVIENNGFESSGYWHTDTSGGGVARVQDSSQHYQGHYSGMTDTRLPSSSTSYAKLYQEISVNVSGLPNSSDTLYFWIRNEGPAHNGYKYVDVTIKGSEHILHYRFRLNGESLPPDTPDDAYIDMGTSLPYQRWVLFTRNLKQDWVDKFHTTDESLERIYLESYGSYSHHKKYGQLVNWDEVYIKLSSAASIEFRGSSNILDWRSLKWILESGTETVERVDYTMNDVSGDHDTWVHQDKPDDNYGQQKYLYVQSYFDGSVHHNRRVYIRTENLNIPSGAEVLSAKLYLYCCYSQGTGTVNVYRVLSNWDEGTLTWNNQPTHATDLTTSISYGTGWREIDVTQDVQGFANGTFQNYGWVLMDPQEDSAVKRYMRFCSSEYDEGAYHPFLVVEYAVRTDGVSVTYQLYNYHTGSYPSSGDGYIHYTSTTSDQTKNQTITSNPTYFRDTDGSWKLKVTFTKDGAKQLRVLLDYIDYKPKMAYEVVELELSGTSNTSDWTALKWSIDASTNGSVVPVTYQLYNYHTGSYPSSGDGYIHYTSTTSDQTKNQTITSNPTYFRDTDGSWKLRITAKLNTPTSYQLKLDWVEYEPMHNTLESYSGFVTSIPPSSIANITIYYTGHYSTSGVTQKLYLYNFTSNDWIQIGGSDTVGTSDVSVERLVTSGFGDYVSGGLIKVKVQGQKGSVNYLDAYGDYMMVKVMSSEAGGGGSVTQTSYLYDFSTSSWVRVGQFNATSMDSNVDLRVSNASKYVSSGEARVRIESKVYTCNMNYYGDYLNLEAVDSSSGSGLSTLTIKVTNLGPIPVHIVSLWVVNSSSPEHYDTNLLGEHEIDLVVPPKETREIKLTYHWGGDTYLIKLVSDKGNIWGYTVSNL